MNITLRQLRALVAVASIGSFTAAGKRLSLTQSTLTKTIRELESQTGLQLFERTTRRVRLTDAAQAFLPVAQRLLNDFDLAIGDLREKASGRSGTLHLASGTAFATTALPTIVSRFQKAFPDVRLHVLDDTSGGIVKRIAAGEVDLGFGSLVGESARQLTARRLLTSRLGVLFPPDCTDIPARLTLDKVAALRLLRDEPDTSIMAVLRQQSADIARGLHETVEVTNLAVQFAMVRAGAGACIISSLAASHPSARGLPFKLIDGPRLARELYLLSRRGRQLSPAAVSFLKVLDAELPKIRFHAGVRVAP